MVILIVRSETRNIFLGNLFKQSVAMDIFYIMQYYILLYIAFNIVKLKMCQRTKMTTYSLQKQHNNIYTRVSCQMCPIMIFVASMLHSSALFFTLSPSLAYYNMKDLRSTHAMFSIRSGSRSQGKYATITAACSCVQCAERLKRHSLTCAHLRAQA